MRITESLRGAARRVDECIWEIPAEAKPGMLVPARLYASGPLLEQMDDGAMAETWGSTAHGAGRTMSRAQAKRQVRGEALIESMAERGILVRAASKSGVAEEAGFAYKDLDAVVDTLHRLDLSRRVVSLTPIGNIKG